MRYPCTGCNWRDSDPFARSAVTRHAGNQSSLKVLTSREAGGPVHVLLDRRTSGKDGHPRSRRARISNTSPAPHPHSTVEESWSSEKGQSKTGRAGSPSRLDQSLILPKTGKIRCCQRDCRLAQRISSRRHSRVLGRKRQRLHLRTGGGLSLCLPLRLERSSLLLARRSDRLALCPLFGLGYRSSLQDPLFQPQPHGSALGVLEHANPSAVPCLERRPCCDQHFGCFEVTSSRCVHERGAASAAQGVSLATGLPQFQQEANDPQSAAVGRCVKGRPSDLVYKCG